VAAKVSERRRDDAEVNVANRSDALEERAKRSREELALLAHSGGVVDGEEDVDFRGLGDAIARKRVGAVVRLVLRSERLPPEVDDRASTIHERSRGEHERSEHERTQTVTLTHVE